MTARVMSLAEPGQILLTKAAFDSARQSGRVVPPVAERARRSRSDEAQPTGAGVAAAELRWLAHGFYRFKGADDPFEVCEVGVVGQAPLRAPANSEKATRAVSDEEDALLGWRPAPGLEVPRRKQWCLECKLGDGAFGEAWLVRHQRTKQRRAFKFCFDAKRLRSFKRELTLFRLIQEALGVRDDIVPLIDFQLDKSPFYLESEYLPSGNLSQWFHNRGGVQEVPFPVRLDLMARIAETIGAVHSLGIIHKDIKPSNIFIRELPDGTLRPALADFGIGVIIDPAILDKHGITVAGFTESLIGNESSRSGTRLYAPPESLLGKPPTPSNDIYALGVLLYQLVAGDLTRPLATGWEADVDDDLLCEDIASCVVRDPLLRFSSPLLLAERLERLEERREKQEDDRARSSTTRAVATFLKTLDYFLTERPNFYTVVSFGETSTEFELLCAIHEALDHFVSVSLRRISNDSLKKLTELRDKTYYFCAYHVPVAGGSQVGSECVLSFDNLRAIAGKELHRRQRFDKPRKPGTAGQC
jgi:serine/threonine-protein kinase